MEDDDDEDILDPYEERQMEYDRRERERAQLVARKQTKNERAAALIGGRPVSVSTMRRQVAKSRKKKRKRVNEEADSDNDFVQLNGAIDDDEIDLKLNADHQRRQQEEAEGQQFVGMEDEKQQLEDAEKKDVEKWVGVNLQRKMFDDANEPEISDDPDYCYMCDYSPTRLDTQGAQAYQMMVDFIQCQWGIVDPVWLITKIQEMYNDGLRQYTDHNRPWYKRIIFDHFLKHYPTIRFILENQLQTFRAVLTTIENNGIFEESTTRPGVVRVSKQQGSVYGFLQGNASTAKGIKTTTAGNKSMN